MLDKLDKDLNKAEAVHDTVGMAEIAQSEADLSGYLVDWAKNNPNAEIKSSAYRYMVFDARTKRLAGTLSTDPAKRQALLVKAMDAYKKLQSPENTTLFKATLDQAKIASGDIDPNQPDPNVRLGIALTDFELKNYKESAEILGDLLNNGKLGPATLATVDATGEQKVVDNDIYWEATYKLYFSNVADAKGDASAQPARNRG